MPSGNVLDSYVHTQPSEQNAIDIFEGEWASSFPSAWGVPVRSGSIPLFEDGRLSWAIQALGGVKGQRILELGPLEGGHSYMLEKAGAAGIISIEANTRAYLKCLITKELLSLKHVRYQCGDFVEYLKASEQQFDVILASGVLYHMRNPVELLSLVASHTDRVYLWTHYYDPLIKSNPALRDKYPSEHEFEEVGFRHTLYRQEYLLSLDSQAFCGGSEEYSHWLSRRDLLDCLAYFGFKNVQIAHEQIDHPHGPCLGLVATK